MATVVSQLNSAVIEALRGRGFSDDAIERMSADNMFDEYCMWNGLSGWGADLRYMLDHVRAVTTATPQ